MWGGKPLAVLLILSMLSACAGRHAPDGVQTGEGEPGRTAPTNYAEAVETRTSGIEEPNDPLLERDALAAAYRSDERRHHGHDRYAHYHDEPSPQNKAVAEGFLLLTGAAFLCTFVVVVLNGACNFGVRAGYYY
ncbi:MAG: hypothetical protein ACR2RF_27495 [Geminicoccaceae bacterium]